MTTPSQVTRRTRIPDLGPRGEGWLVLQLALMAAIFIAGIATGGAWSEGPRTASAVAGALMVVYGMALGYFGIRDLGRSLSPLPRPAESAVLVEHGIYRNLRHPIYAGVILLGIGWSLVTASWLALGLSVGLAVVLDLKARREEVWLRARYPGYAAYAMRTKRFVPGIY